jgi:predicted amidohydrolase YtcJ
MPADVVFTGGPVLTGREPIRTDVAVRGDRIVAVGADAARDLAGPGTEVVDLAGGLLLPGFTDAHVHPIQGGFERRRCDLSEYETRPAYLDAIGSYAAAHPELDWVSGGGWGMAAFPGGAPLAADLDTVVPDRPAFFPNRDHHGAWVNSRALAIAGIDAATPDPPHGRIERDAAGRPTGTLHEGAMDLVARLLPSPTYADWMGALLDAQAYLHALGVTGWQDAIVGEYAGVEDVSDVYLDAAADGRLTARVIGALWWDRERGDEQIRELRARRERLTNGRFRATSVKIMQDGIAENFTAGMIEPYLDAAGRPTGNPGLSFVDPDALRDYVTELDASGFQVHVHAIGDRAVRETLDAFAAARRANGPGDGRHHIAHLQVIHPDDRSRFAALGVAANLQALWAVHEPQMDELNIPVLGPERAGWQYPFADLAASGARLCAGSDWPVSSPDPWAAIHVAVNRRLYEDTDAAAFLPEQALDLATAVNAYTAGSAWVNHLDDAGAIEVGRLADLVVTDRDPFAGPAAEIGSTRVVQTFVGGRRVHPS